MERFAEFLCRDERESGTIETYLRSLRGFAEWAAGWKTTKELLSAWMFLSASLRKATPMP